MVCHHRTVTRILLISVVICDPLSHFPPVRRLGTLFPDRSDQSDKFRIFYVGKPRIQQPVDILLHKGQRLHNSQINCCVDGDSVVADAGRFPGHLSRPLRIARICHGPCVDKNLRADLFRHAPPV